MNILIVESKNDKIFVQALIEVLNIKNTNVEKILIDADNFLFLNSIDPNPKKPTNLIRKLKDVKTDIPKKGIKKIGILLDIDKSRIDDRLVLVNTAIEQAFGKETFNKIEDINQTVSVQLDDEIIEILCYFTNVDENGDLETVLRKIALKDGNYANCLSSWRECLQEKKIEISDKDFDKFWIDNYIRFDTCSKKERKQAERKCSMKAFDYVMQTKKDIFDFSHEVLDGLKEFLLQFKVPINKNK